MEKNANIMFDDYNFFDLEKLDDKISDEEYFNFALHAFEKISKNRFPNDLIKQKVQKHHGRITGSCPYCGDSMQSSWKQRGNIILSGKWANYYKCFNCNKFVSVNEFFRDFNIDLQLNAINYISETKGNFQNTVAPLKYDLSLLLDVKTIEEYAVDRQEIKQRFNLIEVKDSPAWIWLNKRLQFEESKFFYNSSKNYILILNLTPSGKILGFQKRNLNKWQTKYLTFTLSTIYEILGKIEKIPDDINSLSQLYGICFLNFNQPITLFEGPLDSFLFRNSIANSGANKGFPIDLPLRYFYDYDTTGIKKSIEKINKGSNVFLWGKFSKEVGLPHRKKWDLNDAKIWEKEMGVKLPNLEEFFSKDTLDMIDI